MRVCSRLLFYFVEISSRVKNSTIQTHELRLGRIISEHYCSRRDIPWTLMNPSSSGDRLHGKVPLRLVRPIFSCVCAGIIVQPGWTVKPILPSGRRRRDGWRATANNADIRLWQMADGGAPDCRLIGIGINLYTGHDTLSVLLLPIPNAILYGLQRSESSAGRLFKSSPLPPPPPHSLPSADRFHARHKQDG